MVLRDAVGEEAKAAALEKVIEGLLPLEDAFTKCSKGKDFFGGDTIGYLDIAFGSFLGWISAIEVMANVKLFDEIKTPGLFGWTKMFCLNAAVKDVIPETELFVELLKKFAARANAHLPRFQKEEDIRSSLRFDHPVAVLSKWWRIVKVLRYAEGEDAKAAALEQVMEGIMLLEDAFAKCGKGKDFFGGDTIGYLDIALGSLLGWLRATEKMTDIKILDESQTPGLLGWAHRFGSNAAVKDVIPETEKLVEFGKMFALRAKAQWPSIAWEDIFTVGEEAKAAAALEKVIVEGIMSMEDAFAKCSEGKDFFGGDTIGYLDIAFENILEWLRAIEMMTSWSG
ncbi:hypothetical protein RHSIM_RhsimUnG0180000 [Rhododendron simsii]|uniref:glutathione transferase n=1 Tax=Rhododendron simsii TaxID=118357 RepID=A0A834FWN0_RHOSS|nr:hypothetical protein RHSIM_RhsimUnG0180000 [Rhododendron simsii]